MSTNPTSGKEELRELVPDGTGSRALDLATEGIFISSQQTATGAAQSIAHTLGAVPAKVLVSPTDTSPATVGVFTVTEGAHTSTNVVVTVTSGKKYKVLAIA